jgi:hypothetical protein
VKNKSDQDLIEEYYQISNGGVKSFASWWGLNLIIRELKKRDIYKQVKPKTDEKKNYR